MKPNEIIYLNNFGVSKIVECSPDLVYIEPLYGCRGVIQLASDSKNIRPLLKKDEVDKIIDEVKDYKTTWITKFITRENKYASIKKNPTPELILRELKTIYNQYKYKKDNKIKGGLSTRDLDFFHKSLDLLFNEFARVLEIDFKDVAKYISNKWSDLNVLDYYNL
ncbi:MAG: hypothetical protein K6G28_06025 [Acholeplasmatales bacterium]|nr:hypothetical protein [Acholeplasmatales bacterium]